MELNRLPAHKILQLIEEGKASPRQVCQDVIERIEKIDNVVAAYTPAGKEKSVGGKALSLALEIESNTAFKGKLKGIPVAIKDNICTKDEETTCSSRILEGFRPPYDATVVERLKAEGAVLLGKTNMDEFAFGSSCETSCFGPTRNPWNLDMIPGGSSGGSAAAVAAAEAILALGSDTGGSIRQPASLCGVVGLKPTYGRVSRYGLIAFASSLDQIGPITRNVTDAALLLNVIAGFDAKDSTSANISVPDYSESLVSDVKGLKIAIPKEYFSEGIDIEVKNAVEVSIELLKDSGAEIREVSLPHTKYAVSTYYIIAPAEASSNLARFDGVQYGFREEKDNDLLGMYQNTRSCGFGPEAKRRVILGTFTLSSGYYDAYYLQAQRVRTLIRQDFDAVFKEYDCIITPTTPTAAFPLGEKIDDPLSMYLSDVFTISANLAGLPAISIPSGMTSGNLPIGLQILAKPFNEEMLFRVAYSLEQNTQWHLKEPRI